MIKVLSPGAMSSLQDLGRFGQQSWGIGNSGAMDGWAARVANSLLDNAQSATLLEMCASGAELRFEDPTWIAATGADMDARIDGEALPLCRPVWVERGCVLRFGAAHCGCRAYLAVRGGFCADRWLGSTSTDVRAQRGGIEGRRLRRDDVLLHPLDGVPRPVRRVTWSTRLAGPAVEAPVSLPLIPAAALQQLAARDREFIATQAFTVSREADRMGLRLEPSLTSAIGLPAILSQAVAFGAVQLPPDGKPIILGSDRQTTGGYPLLGVVAGVGHSGVAQLRSADRVQFRVRDAHSLQAEWRAREQQFRRFRVVVHAWWQGLE